MSIRIKEYKCLYNGVSEEKWLYEHKKIDEQCYRYVLGKSGKNPLICFGINPSNAHLEKKGDVWTVEPDATMRRVRNVSELLGYDGYIMLNLFPYIDTNPAELKKVKAPEKIINGNLKYIEEILKIYEYSSDLWACWGTSIMNNECLIDSLERIDELVRDKCMTWKTMKWTGKEPKHPHHPLRISSKEVVEAGKVWKTGNELDVDIKKYIDTLRR